MDKASVRSVVGVSVVVVMVAAAGCYPPPATPPPDQDLAHAAQHVTDDILHQLGPDALTAHAMVIDPLLDGRTAQQTRACERVQAQIATSLTATDHRLSLVPFNSAGAAQTRWLITGTLTPLPEPNRFRLAVALTDRQSGIVIAQAVTPFTEANLDLTPTKFYGDSPSLVRDRSTDGYLKTAQTPRGGAADPLYIDQVPTSALLADALAAYNAERWEDALKLYTNAVERQDGQQLRTFNGIYLTNVRLGRMKEAEERLQDEIAQILAQDGRAE